MDFQRLQDRGGPPLEMKTPHSTFRCRLFVTLAIPLLSPVLHAQDRPLTWDLLEVWRVGGLDAPEWAQFTRPDEMAFDGSGNLYVVDGAAVHIVKVGPDGQLVMTIGRAGQGPGEFRSPDGVMVWRDGSFAVNDGGRDALHLFRADGSFERSVRWTVATGEVFVDLNWMRTMRPGPRPGIVYAQGLANRHSSVIGSVAEMMGIESEDAADERTIEALDLSGDVVTGEVLVEGWRPPRPGLTEIDPRDSESVLAAMTEAPQFEPTLRWDAVPGGLIAYADSSTYRIRIVRDGVTVNTLTRPIAPLPFTRGMESEMREGMRRAMEESEGDTPEYRRQLRELIENMTFYPEIPVIERIRVAWDGSVWVERADSEWDVDRKTLLIDVFDPDGDYRGTLAADGPGMPDAFGPDGLAAYWEFDEMDVPSIVVRRLPPALQW